MSSPLTDPTLPVEEPAHSTRQATRLAAGPTSEVPLDSAASTAPTSQRMRKLPREDPDDSSQSDPLQTSGTRLQGRDSVAASRQFPVAKGGSTKTPKANKSTLANNPTQGVVPVVSQTINPPPLVLHRRQVPSNGPTTVGNTTMKTRGGHHPATS